jgi:hypothetical protein
MGSQSPAMEENLTWDYRLPSRKITPSKIGVRTAMFFNLKCWVFEPCQLYFIFLLSAPPSRVYITLTTLAASHKIFAGGIVMAKIDFVSADP